MTQLVHIYFGLADAKVNGPGIIFALDFYLVDGDGLPLESPGYPFVYVFGITPLLF